MSFRLANSEDIDPVCELITAEAARGRFDARLADPSFRAGLKKNLKTIRKRGRRLDQDLAAQLLIWADASGQAAGCLINSEIMPGLGNEIWMMAIFGSQRGQGEGSRMLGAALASLHPRVDLYMRCSRDAGQSCQMGLKRGFLPLDVTGEGTRILKMPKLGATLAGQQGSHQQLEKFVAIDAARP